MNKFLLLATKRSPDQYGNNVYSKSKFYRPSVCVFILIYSKCELRAVWVCRGEQGLTNLFPTLWTHPPPGAPYPRSDARPWPPHIPGHRGTGRSRAGSGTRRGPRRRTDSGIRPHLQPPDSQALAGLSFPSTSHPKPDRHLPWHPPPGVG